MSGNQCADFGGTNFGDNLCRMPAGHANADLITYRDGRAADIEGTPRDGDVTFTGPNGIGEIRVSGISDESIEITRRLQGIEIGDCAARGIGGVSFAALPTTHDGAEITWGPEDYRELNRILGWPSGQSGHAFFCSDRANAGNLVFNNDGFHRPRIVAAIDTLSNSYSGSLDSAHREVLLSSLRAAAGIPEPQSTWDQMKSMAGYLLGGVAVFVIGGFGAHLVSRWWDGRGGGGGSGGGGGNAEDAFVRGFMRGLREAGGATETEAATPAVANPSESGGTAARTGLSPLAEGILAFNGRSGAPSPAAVPAPSTVPNATLTAPGIPLPVVPAPVTIPAPAVAPAPVIAPRMVPVPVP